MDLSTRLSRNLRKRRKDLTQEVFARKLGVSRATLVRLESAAQNTTLKTLQQITKALRCDVDDLFKESP